ncbi:unnamed protein product [Effrenium voratum]|nr:unnamed protein product [Effrenium voratum]
MEGRRLGQGLWQSPLKELPGCGFFPRQHYASVALNSGDQVYVLGGGAGDSRGRYLNDVWRVRLEGAGWQWREVSPHQEGRRDMDGRLLLSKWSGRGRFGCCAAAKGGALKALYVTGGQGSTCFEDFWASTDGESWYCMCQKVPWGGRLDPGLCVVPTEYQQLVLLGGIVPGVGLRVERDLWLSEDAGATWHLLQTPDWEPRSCPVLFFCPPSHGKRWLLVLGGARLSETSAGDRAHAIGPKFLDDAWAVHLDFFTRQGTWQDLGEVKEEPSDRGFDCHSAAFDPSACESSAGSARGAVVLLREGVFYSAAPSALPAWRKLTLMEGTTPAPSGMARPLLAAGPLAPCPRLFVFTASGGFASGAKELMTQRQVLQLLGLQLERAWALPLPLWQSRVVPCLLPRPRAARKMIGFYESICLESTLIRLGRMASMGMLALLSGFGLLIMESARHMHDHWDVYQKGADQLTKDLLALFSKVPDSFKKQYQEASADMVKSTQDLFYSLLGDIVNNVSSLIFGVLLTMLYTLFWLCSPVPMDSSVDVMFRKYILFKTLACFGYGISAGLLLYFLSVDLASVFALTTFALNFVPEVGPFIAMVLPCPVILLDSRLERPILVLVTAVVGQLALKFSFSNVIEVKLIESDKKLRMHPVMILLSVGIFGYLWGPTGMLLSVPLMALLKIALFSELVS